MKAAFENGNAIPEDSHITKEEKDELLKLVEETQSWFAEVTAKLNAAEKWEDATFTIAELDSKKELVIELTNKTLNKPEPKKEEEEKEDEKKEGDTEMKPEGEENAEGEEKAEGETEMKPEAEEKGDEAMEDVSQEDDKKN